MTTTSNFTCFFFPILYIHCSDSSDFIWDFYLILRINNIKPMYSGYVSRSLNIEVRR